MSVKGRGAPGELESDMSCQLSGVLNLEHDFLGVQI